MWKGFGEKAADLKLSSVMSFTHQQKQIYIKLNLRKTNLFVKNHRNGIKSYKITDPRDSSLHNLNSKK
jgi:hypothetical protein